MRSKIMNEVARYLTITFMSLISKKGDGCFWLTVASENSSAYVFRDLERLLCVRRTGFIAEMNIRVFD